MKRNIWYSVMIFCVSDDEAEKLLAEEEDEDLRNALRILLFNAEKVSSDYQSEKIILLLYPDEDFINKTLKAAGLEGDYVMNKNAAPDGHLEIFAFTKRDVRDRTYSYRYYATCDDAVTSSGEHSETDPTKLPDDDATVVSGDRAIIYDDNGNMTGHKDPVNYLSGFTGALKFDSYIMLGTNSDLTAEQVTLIDHYPPNVPKQKTVSKGM